MSQIFRHFFSLCLVATVAALVLPAASFGQAFFFDTFDGELSDNWGSEWGAYMSSGGKSIGNGATTDISRDFPADVPGRATNGSTGFHAYGQDDMAYYGLNGTVKLKGIDVSGIRQRPQDGSDVNPNPPFNVTSNDGVADAGMTMGLFGRRRGKGTLGGPRPESGLVAASYVTTNTVPHGPRIQLFQLGGTATGFNPPFAATNLGRLLESPFDMELELDGDQATFTVTDAIGTETVTGTIPNIHDAGWWGLHNSGNIPDANGARQAGDYATYDYFEVTLDGYIPEPTSAILVLTGALAMVGVRRRRR